MQNFQVELIGPPIGVGAASSCKMSAMRYRALGFCCHDLLLEEWGLDPVLLWLTLRHAIFGQQIHEYDRVMSTDELQTFSSWMECCISATSRTFAGSAGAYGTRLADSQDVDGHALGAEAVRQFVAETNRRQFFFFQIHDGFAADTHQVMMGFGIAFYAQ